MKKFPCPGSPIKGESDVFIVRAGIRSQKIELIKIYILIVESAETNFYLYLDIYY